MKKCSKCQKTKPFEAFGKSKRAKCGHVSACKICNRAFYSSEISKAKSRERTRRRYHENPKYRKAIRDYQKSYRNTANGRAYSRGQIARYLTNPSNKIKHRLRTRMYHVLKGLRKSANTEILIGCSALALKAHIESLFQLGMSWENYGKWHVDHIKPCASFDLTKEEEQRKCFHYSNLQPLWQKDNMSKGDKDFSVAC